MVVVELQLEGLAVSRVEAKMEDHRVLTESLDDRASV